MKVDISTVPNIRVEIVVDLTIGETKFKPTDVTDFLASFNKDREAAIPFTVFSGYNCFKTTVTNRVSLVTFVPPNMPMDAFRPYVEALADKFGVGNIMLAGPQALMVFSEAVEEEVKEETPSVS